MVALKHSAMLTTIFLLTAAGGLCQVKTDTAPRLDLALHGTAGAARLEIGIY
jgi:hypothetical protein